MGKAAKALKTISKLITLKNGYPSEAFNSAIIVAAGSGTRAGGDIPKQFRMIGNMPVVARTVDAFERCPFINEIIIVSRAGEENIFLEYAKQYQWKKLSKVTPGKASRQESVLEGFKAISDNSDYVYIHDGVRCLITPEMIEKVGEQACIHGSAIAATRASDSIKIANSNSMISESPERSTVWQAQTPQVFRTDIYRASAYTALQNGFSASDDSMLVEDAGFPVKLVDCGSENIKITTPIDFAIAKAILDLRNQNTKEQK